MIDLLDGILKLAIEDVAVRNDDGRVEDRRAVIASDA